VLILKASTFITSVVSGISSIYKSMIHHTYVTLQYFFPSMPIVILLDAV